MMKKIFELYKKYKEIINYLIFGFLSTMVNLITYYICVTTILNPDNPVELQIANITAWVVAVIFAYIVNRKFVYESKEKNKVKEATKFISSRLLTLFLDMFVMWLGVSVMKINDKIIKIISQILVIIGNYFISKLFVFKKKN